MAPRSQERTVRLPDFKCLVHMEYFSIKKALLHNNRKAFVFVIFIYQIKRTDRAISSPQKPV